jgi:hypothetical protein
MRILSELRTTDIRVLFNIYEAIAAIEFVLRINLLIQFSSIARKEKIKHSRDVKKSSRRYF